MRVSQICRIWPDGFFARIFHISFMNALRKIDNDRLTFYISLALRDWAIMIELKQMQRYDS